MILGVDNLLPPFMKGMFIQANLRADKHSHKDDDNFKEDAKDLKIVPFLKSNHIYISIKNMLALKWKNIYLQEQFLRDSGGREAKNSRRQLLKIYMKGSIFVGLLLGTIIALGETALTTLAFTGSQDSYQFSPGGIQDNEGESLAPPAITTVPMQPPNWTFFSENSIGDQAQWLHPTNNSQSHPHGYIVTYTSSFHVDCPHQPISIKLAATGAVFLSINDQWQLIWGLPWPEVHHIQVHQDRLKCGCNHIRIDVFNAWWPSPAALIYNITQDQSNCYDCQNQGITFYNRFTCQCQCASDPCNCSNASKKWFGYPRCGCMCSTSLRCPSNSYFSSKSCSCQCVPRCCPKDQFLSSKTCQCQQLQLILPDSLKERMSNSGIIQLRTSLSSSP